VNSIQIEPTPEANSYRPEIVPNDELQGGPCPVYDDYLKLMQECWHQDPEMRPSFEEIIERLWGLMIAVVQSEENTNKSTETAPIHCNSPTS